MSRVFRGSDVLVTVVPMAVVLGGTTAAGHLQPGTRPLGLLGYAWLVAAALPLVVSRRFPLSAFLVVSAFTWSYYASAYPQGPAVVLPTVALEKTLQRRQRPLLGAPQLQALHGITPNVQALVQQQLEH